MPSAAVGLILRAPPGWVLRPGGNLATADFDFANNRAFVRGGPNNLAALLSVTRAQTVSSYAETTAGLLVPFGPDTLRVTDKGLPVEEARTNVVLWSRDLTNAAWTKSNVTAALDQVGADGVAASATSLTATAGNGTVLQAITLGSSARFQSAYVKRLTGTGTINMTMDNGSTWTAITVTSSYTRLTIPTQTLANPTVGFRIVTSGDAIAVDFAQNENTGAAASSPIPTTTVAVTRAADQILLAGPALAAALASKAAYTQTNGCNANSANSNDAIVYFAGTPNQLRFGGSTVVIADNGVNAAAQATIGGAGTFAGRVKAAFAYDASSYSAVSNGGTLVTSAFAWGTPVSTVSIGNRSTDNARPINGYLERLAFGNTKSMFDGMTS